MAKGKARGRGGHQQRRIIEFSRMSTGRHMGIASGAHLDWSTFDALINAAKPKVLRVLADRNDLPAMWQHRALQALREKRVDVSPSEWKSSIERAIQDKNTSRVEIQALQIKLQEFRFVEFQKKLEELSKIHSSKDLLNVERIRFIVQVKDDNFQEIFSSYGSQQALLYYSVILNYLHSSTVKKGNFEINSSLVEEFESHSLKKWKLPNEAIRNWPLEILASFLYLNLTFKLDRVDSLRLFESLRDMVSVLDEGIENLYKQAEVESEKRKERSKQLALELKEREETIAEKQRMGMARAAERQARERREREISRECEELQREIGANFPWPLPCKSASPEAQERLKVLGITVENGKFHSHRPFPVELDRFTQKMELLTTSNEQKVDITYGRKSVFESFTRVFPKDKKSLVDNYQEFTRYLNHKSRYLCEAVYFTMSNSDYEVTLRIDQVALLKSEGVFQGCWVVSIFGLPGFMSQGMDLMRGQVLGRADFLKAAIKDEVLRELFNSVYYVKKKTSEGARSWIGLFIELLEFIYGFEATSSRLTIEPLPTETLKHRERIFETALKRTLWQGDRSGGDGTNFCEICGREIWDAASLARQIGPDCWEKVRLTEQGRAVLSTSSYSNKYDEDRDRLAIPYSTWVTSMTQDVERFVGSRRKSE